MQSTKHQELYDLLYALDFDVSKATIPNQQEYTIKSIIELSEENDCVDEVEKIIKNNTDKNLMRVFAIMWDNELFPRIEIVDDEFDDDDDE